MYICSGGNYYRIIKLFNSRNRFISSSMHDIRNISINNSPLQLADSLI